MRLHIWLPVPSITGSIEILDSITLKRTFYTLGFLLHHLDNPTARYSYVDDLPLFFQWFRYSRFMLEYRSAIWNAWELKTDRSPGELKADYGSISMKTLRVLRVDPWWVGYADYHDSQKATLLAMNYIYYSRFGWDIAPNKVFLYPRPNGRFKQC